MGNGKKRKEKKAMKMMSGEGAVRKGGREWEGRKGKKIKGKAKK